MNKRRDLRLIWQSNGPHTQSGYGVFTKDIVRRLKADGWPIAVSSFYGVQGYPLDWEGVKVYPTMGETFGSDALVNHAADWKANVAFTFQDVPGLNPQFLQQMKYWIPYVPVDQDPPTPGLLNNLRFAYRIITFANFGKEMLLKSGFTSKMIHEGTDTNIFKPLNQKEQLRKEFNVEPGTFIFGMTAANKENPPRKGFQEALEAFKLFHDKHPEARLFMNTQQQTGPGGFPIKDFAAYLGILNQLIWPNDYLVAFKSTSELMNKFYNIWDATLHPSSTEGFGLCIVESQSAGTPVVIQRNHSMPELVVENRTGWIAETAYKRFSSQLGWWHFADVDSLYKKMEALYTAVKTNPDKVRDDARKQIVDNFNIDTQFKELWVPFLEQLQEEIIPVVDVAAKTK